MWVGASAAPVTHEIGDKSNVVTIGQLGGFQADHIFGIDGKTPLTVMNNYSINFKNGGIKGKTKTLHLQRFQRK